MTAKTKRIILCSVAAIGGAVAGFTAAWVVRRKQEERAVEEALEAQRGLYERYLAKTENSDGEITIHVDEDQLERDTPDFVSGVMDVSDKKPVNTHKVDYSKSARISAESGYTTKAELERPVEEVFHEAPYLISEETYSESRLTYDKVRCQYYEHEGVMLDRDQEGFEPMDISTDVSWSCINAFQDDPDLEEIFVRNDGQATDYYVTRCRVPLEEVE